MAAVKNIKYRKALTAIDSIVVLDIKLIMKCKWYIKRHSCIIILTAAVAF